MYCNWAGMFLSVPGTRSCNHEVNIELNKFHAHIYQSIHFQACRAEQTQSSWAVQLFHHHERCCLTETTYGKVTVSFWFAHMGLFLGKKLSLQSRKRVWNIVLPLASPALGYQKNDTEVSHVACLYSLYKCLLLTSSSNLLDACSGFDEKCAGFIHLL